jgi:hypothetical protein
MAQQQLNNGDNTGFFRNKLNDNFTELYGFTSNDDSRINNINSNVQSNSATTWNYQGTDIKALTGFWDSARTYVNSNSGSLTNVYNLTGNYASVYSTVNTNSATWNNNIDSGVRALTSNFAVNSELVKYLPLSGGIVTGSTQINSNLTVYGNISATGTSYFANTVYSTTSALSVVNVGNTGPALYVANNGTGDIASFYDLDQNIEVFHIAGNNGTFPNVGVKTSTPNVDFTVNGQISSNNIITSLGGNSTNWNSVYTNVNTNSANYILDNGNTKGSNLLIGTNDNFNLALETNGSPRITILNSGNVGIGTSTPADRLTIVGNTTLSGLNLTYSTEAKATPTISTNTLTLDLAAASLFSVNLNSPITTFTLTNVPPSPRVYSFTLQFIADGTARAVTWPTGTRWAGGTNPTLTSTLNKIDTFTFLTHDGGSNWFAFISDQNL